MRNRTVFDSRWRKAPRGLEGYLSAMTEQVTPIWAQGLKKSGLYYEGLVDDHH